VLKVTSAAGRSALLAADIEADVLVVPHHG
jgi:hypothetical protein